MSGITSFTERTEEQKLVTLLETHIVNIQEGKYSPQQLENLSDLLANFESPIDPTAVGHYMLGWYVSQALQECKDL